MRYGTRMVCVREVQKSLKESVKLLLEDKIKTLDVSSMFGVFHDHIVTPGKGIILFQGMADHTAESIKSLEGFHTGYVEEAQTLTQRSLELLRPTIREPGSELWFSWNPRSASDPVDAFLRGPEPPGNATVVRTSYRDNPFFPEVLEEERQLDERINRHRYGHIWLGEYEPMAIGAIWDRVTIHSCRRDEAPTLHRIVVAVDPPKGSDPGCDEAGIVVVGFGEDDHGYVLEDASLRGTPKQWGTRTVAMHDKWDADAIVGEINNGGQMVEFTIKTIRPEVRFIEVTATRGKHVRAEPISALYSVGRVHHVGAFPKMEDQMCATTASGYEGDGSPDRMDAMVWGLSELFPSITIRRLDDDDGRDDLLMDQTRSQIGGY